MLDVIDLKIDHRSDFKINFRRKKYNKSRRASLYSLRLIMKATDSTVGEFAVKSNRKQKKETNFPFLQFFTKNVNTRI